jgi:Tol biopolymer transport system component
MDQGACQPAWSPDGKQLIFTSPCLKSAEEYRGSGLFLITFDQNDAFSDPVPLKSITGGGGNYDPAWSLDGQRIAFTSRRDGISQVYIVNLDGSGLLNLNDDLAFNRQPAWSPDGDQLVFTTSRGGIKEIWIMPDTGKVPEVQFSRGGGRDDSQADWSWDGELVVFQRKIGPIPVLVASRPESEGRIDFRVCPDGEIAGYPMAEPSWSPDGNWILFETWPDGKNHNVAYISANCTDLTEVTNDPALDFDPVWRPRP